MFTRRISRTRKQFKSRMKLILIVFLCSIFFIGIGYSLYNKQLEISGTSTIVGWQGGQEDNPNENLVTGTVKFTLQDKWQEENNIYRYKYSAIVTNISNQRMNGWIATMNVPENTTVAVDGNNASVVVEETTLTCTSKSYNSQLEPNATAEFEFQLFVPMADFKYTTQTLNGATMPKEDEVIELTGIIVTPTATSLYPGNTLAIYETLVPQLAVATVTWSSSDSSVATVDQNGNVEAIAVGNAVITATANDLYSATCTITVDSPVVETENFSVEFDSTSAWQEEGQHVVQYIVTIKNISDTNISSWSFDILLPPGSIVKQSWGTTITSVGTTFTLANVGYNGSISPGEQKDFGLIVRTPVLNYVPIATNINAE